MKRTKKILSMLLAGVISVTSLICGSVSASAASAKDLVSKALKEMQNSTTISCLYEYESTQYNEGVSKYKYNCNGFIFSDNKTEYNYIYPFWGSKGSGRLNYKYGDTVYYKESAADTYKAENIGRYMDNKEIIKKYIENILKNLKNIKISNYSKKYYIITGVPKTNSTDYKTKKFQLTINKKDGRLIKYVEKTDYSSPYKAIDIMTYSNICYSDMAISIPDEIKG